MYQMGIFAGEVGHIFAWANTERSGYAPVNWNPHPLGPGEG